MWHLQGNRRYLFPNLHRSDMIARGMLRFPSPVVRVSWYGAAPLGSADLLW
jgi:hypothetical protein